MAPYWWDAQPRRRTPRQFRAPSPGLQHRERRIRGIIRERAEAERIYDEAKRQGYVASLLTQERPNVFRQSVANLEPGREIEVSIRYFHTLVYLRTLQGEGGTMMIEGIKAALDFPHDPRRLRFVCFLTDGFIGNDTEILEQAQKRLGAARIFSIGVGSAPNRYLLDHLARLGRGEVAYLGLRDNAT